MRVAKGETPVDNKSMYAGQNNNKDYLFRKGAPGRKKLKMSLFQVIHALCFSVFVNTNVFFS